MLMRKYLKWIYNNYSIHFLINLLYIIFYPKLYELILYFSLSLFILSFKKTSLKIIEKLGTNDPLVNRSSSEISPNDLPAAIEFLENNIRNNIKIQLDALPFALRTELTLFHALAIVLANLFNGLDSKNVNSMIDNFAENVRNFARETAKENKPNYH